MVNNARIALITLVQIVLQTNVECDCVVSHLLNEVNLIRGKGAFNSFPV